MDMRSIGNADDVSSDDEAPDIALGNSDHCVLPAAGTSANNAASSDEEGHY